MVIQSGDTVYFLFFYQICDFFDQSGFVDQIRKFGDNNTVFSVIHRFNICHSAYTDFTTAGPICLIDTGSTQDHTSGWKIWSLDDVD